MTLISSLGPEVRTVAEVDFLASCGESTLPLSPTRASARMMPREEFGACDKLKRIAS